MLVYSMMIYLLRLIGEDFVIRQLQQLKTNKAISLNDIGARLWNSTKAKSYAANFQSS